MVCVAGLDSKSYVERLVRGGAVPEVACPEPRCAGSLLRGHGWYERYLDHVLFAIRRLRCGRCGVTHALLPEDVCAYRDLRLGVVEQALEAGGGPVSGARAAGQAGTAGRRRVRGWQRCLQRPWARAVAALLAPCAGDWWQRVQATVGAAPGALVRLRRWLGAVYGLFLGGLSGLWRRGRPAAVLRGGSTQVGIWRSA